MASWRNDFGWGVPAADGFGRGGLGALLTPVMDGYHVLRQGHRVRFIYETPGQDGFPHRATEVRPLSEA